MFGAVPCHADTLLTARGCRFAGQPRHRDRLRSWPMWSDRICAPCAIAHRLTKPDHLWTKDKAARMNRRVNDGKADQKTIRRIIFPLNVGRSRTESHEHLRTHLTDLPAASSFARRPNTQDGRTLCE